ncbi:MAG: outer membrane protein assembly factor BamB family protein [Planctomycetota bacterium]|jgi:hypothetical protein
MKSCGIRLLVLTACLHAGATFSYSAEDWPQCKYDCRRSGNVPGRSVETPLGLIGAFPLTDAVFTAPAVADGRVYVVDGSGIAFCVDAATLEIKWKFASGGGKANCNNVCSPAVANGYLHFGTMAGSYYVLDADSGAVVKEIECGEPIFSSPVVSNGRVYFATLGSQVCALEPDGTVCWVWDFVKEQFDFEANRWSGRDWLEHKGSRVTAREQFCCSRRRRFGCMARGSWRQGSASGNAATPQYDTGVECRRRRDGLSSVDSPGQWRQSRHT